MKPDNTLPVGVWACFVFWLTLTNGAQSAGFNVHYDPQTDRFTGDWEVEG